MTIFAKLSILDLWQSSEYASGLLKLFCGGSIKEYIGTLIYSKLIVYNIYLLQSKTFPLFWSYILKHNIQANEAMTKVKEKWSTIKFDFFVLSFSSSSVPDNKCYK